jgi:hypothetical protein
LLIHFSFCSEEDLDSIEKSGEELIWRTSEADTDYSYGRWIFADGKIVGVHLEAKVWIQKEKSVLECRIE